MLVRLLEGIFLIASNVAIHIAVTGISVWRLRQANVAMRSLGLISLTLMWLAVLCVLAHIAEIMIWAVFYLWAGVMPDLETASYFSAVTYATIGYGDITPPEEWRLLASMEGLVGILLCAWSGGFIFAVVSRLIASSADHR